MQNERELKFTEDHPDIKISPAQEKADMLAYLDELEKRLPRFAKRAKDIPEGQTGSVEWALEVGEFWRSAREIYSMSRYGLAAKANTHVNNIRLLEKGLLEPAEMANFVEPYAQAIGDPGLFTEFSQKFRYIGQITHPIPPQA